MEVETPREFFEKTLPSKFDADKAANIEAIVQMNIMGPAGGNWTVTVRDRKMTVKEEIYPSPTITIKLADSDFLDIVNGKQSGIIALMRGRLEVKGNIAVGMKLMDIGLF
jgi:putative sterol carrier protein